MTKSVRIENADTSNHVVCVEVWHKEPEGDKLVTSYKLAYPADLMTLAIWSNRYLVIREEPLEAV